MDGIPVHSRFILLTNDIVLTKGLSDVLILHQTLEAPQPNTKGSMCGLNCQAAVNMQKEKAASAEYVFNIDGCGFRTKVLANKTNVRTLSTHQGWIDNHKPCVITLERFDISHATT